jgi:capsular polysaccharide biosynthesis protein
MVRLVALRLLENYFRHRWLYLLPIVLMTAAAGAYLALSKPLYLSEGTIYVRKESLLAALTQVRDDGYVWNTAANVAVTDLQELVRTEAFVRAVFDETDMKAAMADPVQAGALIEWYRQQLTVAAMGENLIRLGITDESPATAHQLADATIRVYKAWKLNVDQQESAVAQAFFTDLISPLQKELDDARAKLDAFLEANPDPVRGERPLAEQLQIQRYQDVITSIDTRLQDAITKEESARLAMSQAESDVDQTYLLIDAPKQPTEPETSLKQMAITAAIFVAVGVILSTVAIIGGVVLDRSLRLGVDVRHELQLPVLAQVADATRLPKVKGKRRGKAAAKESPEPPVADLRLEDKPAQ